MTAKIDWYREVLELEPNSKLFFPLARLLAEDGKKAEAVSILEKGLVRHPEYLEARLFLIELLYQEGKRDECNAEIRKLDTMFSSYAGFWQAWAACLASDECQAETASIIRFLAAHFVSGPLKLHDVINAGLDAMLKEGKAKGIEPTQKAAVESPAPLEASGLAGASVPEGAADFAEHSQEMLEDLDAALDEEAQPKDASMAVGATAGAEVELAANAEDPLAAMLPAEEEAADAQMAEPQEEVAVSAEDPLAAMPPAEEEAADAQMAEPQEELAVSAEDPLADMPPAEEEAAAQMAEPQEELAISAEDPLADMLPAEEISQKMPDGGISVAAPASDKAIEAEAQLLAGIELPEMEAAGLPEDEFMEDEHISLRTRSMAEVLAEQGDISGALEIYRELAAAATSADEEEDINRRIATLESRLKLANASSSYAGVDAATAARSKEKLIGMLEALAERVEARAGG